MEKYQLTMRQLTMRSFHLGRNPKTFKFFEDFEEAFSLDASVEINADIDESIE